MARLSDHTPWHRPDPFGKQGCPATAALLAHFMVVPCGGLARPGSRLGPAQAAFVQRLRTGIKSVQTPCAASAARPTLSPNVG